MIKYRAFIKANIYPQDKIYNTNESFVINIPEHIMYDTKQEALNSKTRWDYSFGLNDKDVVILIRHITVIDGGYGEVRNMPEFYYDYDTFVKLGGWVEYITKNKNAVKIDRIDKNFNDLYSWLLNDNKTEVHIEPIDIEIYGCQEINNMQIPAPISYIIQNSYVPVGNNNCNRTLVDESFYKALSAFKPDIQELTPGKNVVFATGTPISNSMCELYTMQKYLQLDRLEELGIEHFDAWSANFGEVVTSMELAPEGQTYRERTRFAKFVNLPELISLYKEFADIQLPDMLDLKIPKLKNNQFTIIESEPDSVTETYMKDICKRAEAIHNHAVDPSEDNMLKICNDGRLLAADTRLINMDNDTYEDSKIMKCVDNIVKKYYESQDILGTQIVFSDIGTPNMKWSVDWEKVWKEKSIKSDRSQFDLYNCIKTELVKRGIPADEICYIHDANSDVQKSKMFDDMNSGKKRIIFGSTGKMGTGTNIQKRCVAMHELDVPWRPSDVEQREGRILRQGNINEEVEIFRYVTKGTFDAYNWNIIVNKQKFISQIMTSKDVTRECNDIDDSVLNYSEVMSIASGNPYIKELNEIEMELKKLTTYKRSYEDNHIAMKVNINKLPNKIEAGIKEVNKVVTDINKRDTYFNNHKDVDDKLIFSITVADKQFTDKEEANKYIQYLVDKLPVGQNFSGEYCGFKYNIYKEVKDFTKSEIFVSIKGERAYTRNLSTDNVRIIHNALVSMNEYKEHLESIVERDKRNYAVIQEEYNKPFEYADRLEKLTARKRELTEILYKKENNLNGEELATNEKEKVAEKSGGLRR